MNEHEAAPVGAFSAALDELMTAHGLTVPPGVRVTIEATRHPSAIARLDPHGTCPVQSAHGDKCHLITGHDGEHQAQVRRTWPRRTDENGRTEPPGPVKRCSICGDLRGVATVHTHRQTLVCCCLPEQHEAGTESTREARDVARELTRLLMAMATAYDFDPTEELSRVPLPEWLDEP